ncbi:MULTISPECIES: 6-phospho-beta-glucosidase [unclassified Paenibacillus]|uniref:6-phospho-beta-glucosidase n=1 Tax=unclassified Paenibacillus TaxID=185978 RepID=UPI002406E9F0|nr:MULTISPECIES: 6-phospho-beta-glucosidase [unclassified Paenibacillus]MDF9839432.1 6-phospho-beta-glucosidase [Paenibacillus sp. PastF-2]MDF9846012.1 6-phospho-beta-glucosidase [Paenibacillus sp. PastM-2]MDF9852585.1 6-phospho-beta-glucosidase [Paenibacillus sp. PastF-1]MDH6477685.1 6-phospho-beta-glucosidase [Paenibacillus sp. PastH-2]MDH6505424.1 6-phospho-beta-glucosidase [Paenibacillus sp. PastM-3]
MAERLKVAVIGGGSSYTPELIEGFILNYATFPVTEIVLVDIQEGFHKLSIVGELARRMIARSGLPIELSLTLDRCSALTDASFVTTQMRVGRLEARGWDETIPLKYGMIGQETTGPGGMMKALRTIPVLLEVARDMEQLCPDAWLLNFTNPAGMVTEAIHKHSRIKSIGLCNSPIAAYKWLSELYQVPIERIYCEFAGLNHLHWISTITIDGESKLPELLANRDGYSARNVPQYDWNATLLSALKAIPSYYLKYFYLHREILAEQQEAAARGETRAETVQRLEDELFELYKDEELAEKPKQLEQRGGAYYSEAAVRLMNSLYNDSGDIQTLNVPNQGILGFLPDDACIEVNCKVHKNGPVAMPVTVVPEAAKGLIHAVKTYEGLAIEAAVSGSRATALLALAHHPLVPSVNAAEAMLDEMLEQNKAYLPGFYT